MYSFKQYTNMLVRDVQDKLRAYIRALVEQGELTGTQLSQRAGFQQAHLSNFLSARRGLSLEAMDSLLQTLHLGLSDLLGPQPPPSRSPNKVENIAIVSPEQATRLPRFPAEQVSDTISFKKSFLRTFRPHDMLDRRDWLRFVLVKLNAHAAGAVFPGIPAGATLLIDRHYNSLQPYRRRQPNIYVVAGNGQSPVGYVSISGDHLLLRPRNPHYPVEIVRIERGRSYAHYIVGRVCYASMEV